MNEQKTLYYCENCNALSDGDCCQICNRKSLRRPEKGDYCFLTEMDAMGGEMFKGILSEEGIPNVSSPSGSGMRSAFGLRLENLKIFVTYEFFTEAKELFSEVFLSLHEPQKSDFLSNLDALFLPQNTEKKIKKRLKMKEGDSLTAYCKDGIKNADSIVNKGKISGCTKGGEYIFVYKGEELIIVNSATYEIISVEKAK